VLAIPLSLRHSAINGLPAAVWLHRETAQSRWSGGKRILSGMGGAVRPPSQFSLHAADLMYADLFAASRSDVSQCLELRAGSAVAVLSGVDWS
jgi:hypothetical protein